jgi:CO/xanthine dehydrogenase FAD-binding subunit
VGSHPGREALNTKETRPCTAFTFERPSTLADAQRAAARRRQVLAGGQTLLASMKLRLANPEQLVDLGGIAELAGIRARATPS